VTIKVLLWYNIAGRIVLLKKIYFIQLL